LPIASTQHTTISRLLFFQWQACPVFITPPLTRRIRQAYHQWLIVILMSMHAREQRQGIAGGGGQGKIVIIDNR
jgi:hypothetical protein